MTLLQSLGQQPGEGPQLRLHRRRPGCDKAQCHPVFAHHLVKQAEQAMLEQIKELGRRVILGSGPLLQPFLIGVGQRAVGAAETEHRCAEG